MPLLDGPPGPFIVLALSVALAAYNVLFLYNVFRRKQEVTSQKSNDKSKKIIRFLKPQVFISLSLMLVLLVRIMAKPVIAEHSIAYIDVLALVILLVLWLLMCFTAWVSYPVGENKTEQS